MTNWIERELSIWQNVKNIWWKLSRPFRKFFSWAIKVAQYSVVLWKDGEWDHCYFLILMQYKLSRMRKFFQSKNCHVLKGDEVAAQIKHAEDLIERWLDDDFCADLVAAHEAKWGPVVNRFTPVGDGSGNSYWDMYREKSTTPELKEQEKNEQRVIWTQQGVEKEKTLDEIFSHIRLFLENWWD
jgi:hypothetical protein